jgi:hypothetical protein
MKRANDEAPHNGDKAAPKKAKVDIAALKARLSKDVSRLKEKQAQGLYPTMAEILWHVMIP